MEGPHTPPRPAPVAALAHELSALPPSCGPVRLAAVDGHAGSGKTTFAARLAAELGGAPILHLDDLATHREFFAWTGRLRRQVLDPLSRGETAVYEVYDWVLGRFAERRTLAPAPVVVVEGVGAGRRALRPYLARLLWMELDPDAAWECGRRRDGPALAGFWDAWTRAERAHFADDASRPYADALVLRRDGGYELHPGPARAA